MRGKPIELQQMSQHHLWSPPASADIQQDRMEPTAGKIRYGKNPVGSEWVFSRRIDCFSLLRPATSNPVLLEGDLIGFSDIVFPDPHRSRCGGNTGISAQKSAPQHDLPSILSTIWHLFALRVYRASPFSYLTFQRGLDAKFPLPWTCVTVFRTLIPFVL